MSKLDRGIEISAGEAVFDGNGGEEKKESKAGALAREIISLLLHFGCLMVIDIYFRVLDIEGNLTPLGIWPSVIASGFWCLIISTLAILMPGWLRRIYIVATTLIFSLLVVVHSALESFFGQYMSFSSLMYADDGAGYFEWEYFDISGRLITVLVLCIALSVLCALILPKTGRYKIRGIILLVLVTLYGVGIGVTDARTFSNDFGGITWDSTKSPVEYYEEFTDYNYCMHMCGLYHYTMRDIYVSTGAKDLVDKLTSSSRITELDRYYENKVPDGENEMSGVFEGDNLLLIQLESIDSWMVNDISMPTLNSLCQKGINFTEFYAPKYLWAATFSSESAVNTGVLTPMNSSKMSYFTETEYPHSLPNLFSEAGYEVNSFHRSGRNMYNRGEIHENWGYEKYVAAGDLDMNWDMDSEILKAYDEIVSDEKFMSFIITYTGHGPYNSDGEPVKKYEEIIRPQLPSDAEDEYVYALCHAYETDIFIKGLLEKLEADGRLEDTVLIFYTDHYDHYVTGDGILKKYKGTDDANLMSRVPCLIYKEGLEAATLDKVTATYDLTPTIVNLFGLASDGRYYIGNDAFSEKGGYVIFKDSSWYDAETYFNIDRNSATELSQQRSKEISERLNASFDSVKLNYFKGK